MAQLRRVVRDNPVSNFTQVAPQGGLGFSLLAEAAEQIYDRVAPVAVAQQKERGEAAGREWARQQIGGMPSLGMGAGSGGGGAAGSYSHPNAAAIREGLVSRGLPPHVADAFIMNFQDESGLNPSINEAAPIVPGSRGGFGLAQWTGPRRVSLEQFAAAQGRPVSDENVQMDFLMQELQGSESRAAQSILGAPDTATAAQAIVRDFLRPLPQHVASRSRRYASAASDVDVARQQPEVVVRTSEGRLEPRMFSPYSGPILQAHNIAAGIGYNAEMLEKGAVDLFDLSTRFPLNPDRFSEAAQGYIDQVVEQAPDSFKAALRGALSDQVSKRVLGMVEERHRDIRQRADNSSRALSERHSTEYAEAIAAGSETEIESARARLQDTLRGREALPGVAWTPAQSFNAIADAERTAQRMIATAATEQRNTVKGWLSTIATAAKDGLTSAYDGILSNPAVRDMAPPEYDAAMGWRLFADNMPDFNAGTPAERAAAVQQARDIPIDAPYQAQIISAAETQNRAITKAWSDSPIDAAQAYLPNPPPDIPAPDDTSFAAALAARRDYSQALVDNGYTDEEAFFSEAENQAFSQMLAKTSPVEMRAAVAVKIVAALGDDAVAVLQELSAADPVTMFGAMLAARGGDEATFIEAMRGQAALDERLVQAPTPEERRAGMSPEVRATVTDAVLAARLSPEAELGKIMNFATALYASNPEGGMEAAVQRALGQSSRRGKTTGGVQSIMGHDVLLPVGIAGEELENAMKIAAGIPRTRLESLMEGAIGQETTFSRPEAWIEASGSMPHAAGEPVKRADYNRMRMVPLGGTRYRMEIMGGQQPIPVEAADGLTLIVDVEKLIEATR